MTPTPRRAAPHAGSPAIAARRRRGAAPPRARRHPPPRRAAPRRPPRASSPATAASPARPGPTQPGDDVRRIDWNVTARMPRHPRPRDHRRPRAGDLGAASTARPASTSAPPRCEKRDLALAAVGRHRLPHRAHRQPRSACIVAGADGRRSSCPAGTGRRAPAGHAARRHPALRRQRRRPGRPDRRHRLAWRRAGQPPPGPGRRGLRLPRPRPAGSGPCAASPSATRCWPSRSSTPGELALPDVGMHRRWSTPRPAPSARSRPATARSASATPPPPPRSGQAIARGIRAAGADHLVLRTDRDWLLDIVRFVSRRKQRRRVAAGTAHR